MATTMTPASKRTSIRCTRSLPGFLEKLCRSMWQITPVHTCPGGQCRGVSVAEKVKDQIQGMSCFILFFPLISHILWNNVIAPRSWVIATLQCHLVAKDMQGQHIKQGSGKFIQQGRDIDHMGGKTLNPWRGMVSKDNGG